MSLHTWQAADPPSECVVGGMINLLIVAVVWESPRSKSSPIVSNVALCRKKRAIVAITLTLCTAQQGAAFYFVCVCIIVPFVFRLWREGIVFGSWNCMENTASNMTEM